jgi:glycosyltransferase involved in cell wall biosynthesis
MCYGFAGNFNNCNRMVSIIISAHIDRGWLDEAILSAKNQTFIDKEIILSSDGNWSLKEYADRHGIGFCCSPKHNHSFAFFNAAQMASGEWIKECHDDDELLPNAVADLYKARRGAELVYANAIDVWETTDVIYRPPAEITLSSLLPVVTNPINFLTIMFRRDAFFSVGGFDFNLVYAEDYDFYLSLLQKGYKFNYCNKEVVRYRHHDKQLTAEFDMGKREWVADYISKKHKL